VRETYRLEKGRFVEALPPKKYNVKPSIYPRPKYSLRELFHGPIQWNSAPAPPSAGIRWPQWSADGRSTHFVVDIDQRNGALFRIDPATGAANLFLPDVVNYEVFPPAATRATSSPISAPWNPSMVTPITPTMSLAPMARKVSASAMTRRT
jgi:hypothetical protein